MKIGERINAVRAKVEYVQKDTEVQGYKAVTHDQVTATLRPALVEFGIIVATSQEKGKMLQLRDKASGIPQHLYEGRYSVRFINADDITDFIEVHVHAHAADTGDKAPGKAMSYATKNALLKTFSLETGENDEGRFADPYTAEQFAVYHDLVETGKAYEFYLFIATLPPEAVTGLLNSFPDGKITKGKKAAGDLESEGRAQFAEVVEDIQARVAQQDDSVLEVTDEMSTVEKQFLMRHLSDFEVRALGRMKEQRGEV